MILRSSLLLPLLVGALVAAQKAAPAPGKEVIRLSLPSTPGLVFGDFAMRHLMKMSGFAPVALSSERPASVKKEPTYKGQPLYAALPLGNLKDNAVVVVLDDEAQAVWIDSNRNGDLTDDALVAWTWQTTGRKKEGEKRRFEGNWTVEATFDLDGKRSSRVPLAVASSHEAGSDKLFFRVQNARSGRVVIQGKPYSALVMGHSPDGSVLSDPKVATERKQGLGSVWIDLDGNGSFAPMGVRKVFAMGEPVKFFDQWVKFESTVDGSLVVGRTTAAPPEAAFKPLPPKKVGDTAPDFEMVLPNGAKTKLSDHKGKYVVLDFWATWCGPCQAALPKVEEHWKALKHNANLAFLGVCVSDDKTAFDKWIQEKGASYSFSIGFDPEGKQKVGKNLMYRYGVGAIPTTFVIDPEGAILAVYTGLTPENEKALVSLLASKGIQER